MSNTPDNVISLPGVPGFQRPLPPVQTPPHAVKVNLLNGQQLTLTNLVSVSHNEHYVRIEHGSGSYTVFPMPSVAFFQVQQEAPSGIVAAPANAPLPALGKGKK